MPYATIHIMPDALMPRQRHAADADMPCDDVVMLLQRIRAITMRCCRFDVVAALRILRYCPS